MFSRDTILNWRVFKTVVCVVKVTITWKNCLVFFIVSTETTRTKRTMKLELFFIFLCFLLASFLVSGKLNYNCKLLYPSSDYLNYISKFNFLAKIHGQTTKQRQRFYRSLLLQLKEIKSANTTFTKEWLTYILKNKEIISLNICWTWIYLRFSKGRLIVLGIFKSFFFTYLLESHLIFLSCSSAEESDNGHKDDDHCMLINLYLSSLYCILSFCSSFIYFSLFSFPKV